MFENITVSYGSMPLDQSSWSYQTYMKMKQKTTEIGIIRLMCGLMLALFMWRVFLWHTDSRTELETWRAVTVCDQLSRVLSNDFTDTINKCIIVDCRYPYEFDAGHIQVDMLFICTRHERAYCSKVNAFLCLCTYFLDLFQRIILVRLPHNLKSTLQNHQLETFLCYFHIYCRTSSTSHYT